LKKQFHRLREVTFIAALPFAVAAILSDVLIAVTLCILLGSSRTEFEDTNSLINKLMVFAINRTLLTSVVAIAEVIVFVILPNSFYTFGIDFIIGKLYANSFLATLNSRQAMSRSRPKGKQSITTDEDMSTSFRLGTAARRQVEVDMDAEETGISSTMDDDRLHHRPKLEKYNNVVVSFDPVAEGQ